MNIQSKSPRSSSINWKQIAIIAVVLGVAGFKYFNSRKDAGPRGGDTAQIDVSGEIDLDADLARKSQAKQSQSGKQDLKFKPIKDSPFTSSKSTSNSASGPYLTKRGSKQVSPAGLVYARSRIEHVMRHSHDIPDRNDSNSHGVFDVDSEDAVFRLLDEAYKKVKSNSRDVSKQGADPNASFKKVVYTVNMKRRIGYLGGRKGKRDGNPALSKIVLVLGNDVEVVTAYPK